MRKGGGKQKGASFEREICRKLSLWLSNGANEDHLWRSAMSGGRSTVAAAKGKRLADQAGDISAITPLGHSLTSKFMIELKFYRDLGFASLHESKGNLAKFWLEARRQAVRYDKLPMLIAKQNQRDVLVCLSGDGIDTFKLRTSRCMIIPQLNMHVVTFDNFLKYAVKLDVPHTLDRPP